MQQWVRRFPRLYLSSEMSRFGAFVVVVMAAACGQPSTLPLEQALPIHELELPESIRIDGGRVVTGAEDSFSIVLELSNTSSDSVELRHGECFARLRAYARPALQEPAIWDDQRIEGWFCFDRASLHSLGPQASDSLVSNFSTRMLVSWPPPPFSHLGMVLVVNGERLVIPVKGDWQR